MCPSRMFLSGLPSNDSFTHHSSTHAQAHHFKWKLPVSGFDSSLHIMYNFVGLAPDHFEDVPQRCAKGCLCLGSLADVTKVAIGHR